MVRAQVVEGVISYFDLAVGCCLSTIAQAVGPRNTTRRWYYLSLLTFILRFYLWSKKTGFQTEEQLGFLSYRLWSINIIK